MAWDATHLGRGLWSANIFAPHPLALAYSEHFLPQALLALPVYAATRNPILGYNIVFFATFVLCGAGMFLFVRELTGNAAAGFIAGLAFAFTPYRIASIPHLQVLSSAWMPFVLFGLRRHFETRRVAPLAGAAAAWVLQNLSCGYYLLFFSPVAAAYIVWELSVRRLWRDRRELVRVTAACIIVFVVTAPFLLPYLELRALGFNPRSLDETRKFSADVYAYFTADPNLRLWGGIVNAWPKAEGFLFPGITIVALASIAIVARLKGSRFFYVVMIYACVVLALLLDYSIRLPGLKITSLSRVLVAGAIAAAMALSASRSTRAAVVAWLRTPAAFFALVTVFAIAMSFGPDIHAKGRTVASTNVYALFYNDVPGFDGLRVPARFAAIAALALATLAGLGTTALADGPSTRWSRLASLRAIACITIVAEAVAVPIPMNQNAIDYTDKSLAPLPASIGIGAGTPPVYGYLAQLPASAVVVELPLGEPA